MGNRIYAYTVVGKDTEPWERAHGDLLVRGQGLIKVGQTTKGTARARIKQQLGTAYPGLKGVQICRGWCNKHYLRWYAHGDPTALLISRHEGTVEERFWAKVEKTDTCWLWTARKNAFGYGNFSINRKSQLAHRVAYEWAVGPIPDGLEIDHLCHNRACVNPEHLRAVTHKQNLENHDGARADSLTGIRGVSWNPKAKRWVAAVNHDGERILHEYFTDLHEAEMAVVAKRRELHTHNDRDR